MLLLTNRRIVIFALAAWLGRATGSGAVFTVANSVIEARFEHSDATGLFSFVQLLDRSNGSVWRPPTENPTSPIRLRIDEESFDAQTPFHLVSTLTEDIERGGQRTRITLSDLGNRYDFVIDLEVFGDHPVVRQRVLVRARSGSGVVKMADFLPWTFATPPQAFRAYRVNQWAIVPREVNFEPVEGALEPDGEPVTMLTGSGGIECAWLAIRDGDDRGLFWGWEFNGLADVRARRPAGGREFALSGIVRDLAHPILPAEPFEVPPSFIGLFQGDWDEAGYQTQRFAETAIAKPSPDASKFPYVIWDSWGYQKEINEETLRKNAAVAAKLGIEAFIVDLGWAKRMGDWEPDPEKFPSGLRALSDYVHSLGMKFGLHFVPTEADPESAVLRAHPEWRSSRTYFYHGADSICPSNPAARDWIVNQAVRIIGEYNVDWILQDGQTLVKECRRAGHGHRPDDSNYSNSVDGIDRILDEVQRRAPQAVWENCANGGSMMTFRMLRQYVTSITNDASGALGARQGMYGATFPFPPRYADRYMPETKLSPYTTRSFMFGGPWIFMNKLAEMSDEDLELAAREIGAFKRMRTDVVNGKVFHLTAAPGQGRFDAVQSVDPRDGSSVVVVTREKASSSRFLLRLQGLTPARNYRVTFADSTVSMTMSGRELMAGLPLEFDALQDSEIVYLEGLR